MVPVAGSSIMTRSAVAAPLPGHSYVHLVFGDGTQRLTAPALAVNWYSDGWNALRLVLRGRPCDNIEWPRAGCPAGGAIGRVVAHGGLRCGWAGRVRRGLAAEAHANRI